MDLAPGNDTAPGSTLLFQELGIVPLSEQFHVQPPPVSEDESYSNSNSSESDGDEWESPKKEVQRKGKRGRKPKERQGDDLTCKICNRSFTVSASLARHMVTRHSQNSHRYPCDICGKKFTGKHSVATHKLMVHGGKAGTAVFPCKKCELTFLKHPLLKTHIKEAHIRVQMIGPEFRYACTEENCERSYVKKTNLEIHIKDVHVDNTQKETNFKQVCQICNKRFQYPSFLRRHMPIHDESPALVQCTLCPRKLRPDLLNKHIYECHRGDEQGRYKSKFCDRLFGDCHRRNEHDSVHRKKGTCRPPRKFQAQVPFLAELKVDDIMDMEKNEKSGVIACRTCGVEFKSLRSLKSHQMLHASIELQHPCPICQLKFRHENSLRSHIDTVHNRKAKYKSKFCDLTFRSNQARDEHDKVHSKEGKCIDNRKPLDETIRVCQLCDPPQEFKGSYLFRIHQKTIHQIQPKARARSKKSKGLEDTDIEEKEMSSDSHGDDSDSETETESGSESELESEVESEPNVDNPPIRNWEGFTCKLCPLEFRSQRNLNSHRKMKNAHPQLKIKLLKLKRRTVEAGTIFALKLNAKAPLWFICVHCGRASQSLQVAQHHQQLHGDASKTTMPKIRAYPKSHKRSSSYWPLLELSKQTDPVEVIVKEEPTEGEERPEPSDFNEGIDSASFYFESTMKFNVESPDDFAVSEAEPHSSISDHHYEEDYILPDVDWENNVENRDVLQTKERSGEFYMTSNANEAGAEVGWETFMTPIMVRHLSLLECKLCSLRFHLGNVRQHVQKHIDNGELVGQNQAGQERVNYQGEASEQFAPPPIKRARIRNVVGTGTDTLILRVKSEVIPEEEEQQVPIGFKIFAGETGKDVEWDPLAMNTDQSEEVVDLTNEPSLLTTTNISSNVNDIEREEVVDFTNESSLLTTTNTSSNVKTIEREVIDLKNEPSPFTTTNASSNVNAIELLGSDPLTRVSQQPSRLISKLVAVKKPCKELEIAAAKNVEDHLGLRKILPRILPLPSLTLMVTDTMTRATTSTEGQRSGTIAPISTKENASSTIKCALCECGIVFSVPNKDGQDGYEEHWLSCHGMGKMEKCSIPPPATATFGAEAKFMEIVDSEDKPFLCKFCSRKFKSKSDICAHVQREHPTAQCVTCKLVHFGEFKIFYCMNSESLSTTELCSTSEREEEWEKTCMQIIEGDLPFQCKFCRFKYRSKLDFLEHVARLHSYQRRRFFHPGNPSSVSDLKKKVSVSNCVGSQESRTRTMPTGGQGSEPALPLQSAAEISRKDLLTFPPNRTYVEIVDLVESEPKSMEIVETDHTFQCKLCSKNFKTKPEISEHVSTEHSCGSPGSRTPPVDVSKVLEKEVVVLPTPPAPEREGSIGEVEWGKTLMQKIEGDRPYQCTFCGEKCKTKADLLYHGQEKHKVERRLCINQERSRRKKAEPRGEHKPRRTANGATAFECLKCGRIYSKKHSAQAHISRNHGLPSSKGHLEEIYNSPQDPIERVQVGGIKVQLSGWAKKYMEIIKGERPFQCKLCPKQFALKHLLFRHLHVHREARCEKCSKVHRAGDVECRKPDAANSGLFYCDMCGAGNRRKDILKAHRFRSQRRQEPTPCEMSWMIYNSKEATNPFQCKVCTECFPGRCSLRRHCKLTSHSIDAIASNIAYNSFKGARCFNCNELFKSWKELEEHTLRMPECRAQFESLDCTLCEKKFKKQGLLRKHMSIAHPAERRHLCAVCGFAAKTKGHLDTHSRLHLKRRPFKCDFCKFRANTNGNLQLHRRTHTGEKPFLCEECPYAAISMGTLKWHSRKHAKNRPDLRRKEDTHTCDICSKVFTSRRGLANHKFLQHESTSNGAAKQTAYTCTICNKQFTQRSNAGAHVKRHHSAEIRDSSGESNGKGKILKDLIHVDKSKRPVPGKSRRTKYEFSEGDESD